MAVAGSALAIFALMIFYPFINSIFINFTSGNLLYAKSAFINLRIIAFLRS